MDLEAGSSVVIGNFLACGNWTARRHCASLKRSFPAFNKAENGIESDRDSEGDRPLRSGHRNIFDFSATVTEIGAINMSKRKLLFKIRSLCKLDSPEQGL
jgi:hypothetical protein